MQYIAKHGDFFLLFRMSQGHEHVTTYCMYIHRHKGHAHPLPQATWDLQSDRFHDPCREFFEWLHIAWILFHFIQSLLLPHVCPLSFAKSLDCILNRGAWNGVDDLGVFDHCRNFSMASQQWTRRGSSVRRPTCSCAECCGITRDCHIVSHPNTSNKVSHVDVFCLSEGLMKEVPTYWFSCLNPTNLLGRETPEQCPGNPWETYCWRYAYCTGTWFLMGVNRFMIRVIAKMLCTQFYNEFGQEASGKMTGDVQCSVYPTIQLLGFLRISTHSV